MEGKKFPNYTKLQACFSDLVDISYTGVESSPCYSSIPLRL